MVDVQAFVMELSVVLQDIMAANANLLSSVEASPNNLDFGLAKFWRMEKRRPFESAAPVSGGTKMTLGFPIIGTGGFRRR